MIDGHKVYKKKVKASKLRGLAKKKLSKPLVTIDEEPIKESIKEEIKKEQIIEAFNQKINKKNKKKGRGRIVLKRITFFLLILLVAIAGLSAFYYYKLQPDKHFKQVPVVGNDRHEESNGSFNVLLLGSDARPDETVSRTDSIVIVHVDLNKKKYNMLSIPRDTRIYLEGYGYTKITHVQALTQSKKGTIAGIEETVKQVSKLTGLTINYYAETDYRGFRSMVDAIGGIEMHIPFTVKLTHPWNLKNLNKVIEPGTHFFNGEMVSEIIHERYSLPEVDYSRQQLQKEALIGIVKALEKPANIAKLPDLIKAMPEFLIASNISTEDMLSFALAARGFEPNQLQYYQITGKGQELYDDVLGANNYQIVLNQEEMESIIEKYFKD